jgi:hypothetical protein
MQYDTPYEKFFYDLVKEKPITPEDKYYDSLIRYYTQSYRVDNEKVQEVHKFVNYCASLGIYVVINVMPNSFEIRDSMPSPTTDNPDERKFLVVLDDLNSLPNCSVITMRDRNTLKQQDKTIFHDPIHLSVTGAEVYTNWLADQMLKDQKIMTALKTPRKPNEFFVKKYAKKGYRKFAGYFKKTKNEKKVMIAQPQKNPMR